MKKLIFIIFICFISSCRLPSAGTLGGWGIHVFPISEKDLDSYLKLFYQEYPQFKVPVEKQYAEQTWKTGGYSTLKSMFFYIEKEPSRIYYVTYIDAGFGVENPEYARIALRAVYKEDDRWYIKDDLSEKEQEDIKAFFEKEIISRLEKTTGTKSYIQK